jgi:hypothetical protein
LLLDHIRADRYPSVTHMNMLEQIATPRVLVEYTLQLFDRIEADKYPSIPMMQRVQRLVPAGGSICPPASPGRSKQADFQPAAPTGGRNRKEW